MDLNEPIIAVHSYQESINKSFVAGNVKRDLLPNLNFNEVIRTRPQFV